ncbi:MAG: hypothetical protein GY715_12260 [Planctomycetes bacterium]|nr:hypothetical protein [Planctomycetota bacterium]
MPSVRRDLRVLVVILLAIIGAGVATADRPPPQRSRERDRGREVVVTGTLEAATGQPMVHLRISDRERVLTAKPGALQELLGDDAIMRSLPAYLDTGASGYVISSETAARFGIARDEDSVYHEVGLHGEVPMGVSRPYALAVAGVAGDPAHAAGEFRELRGKASLLLNQSKSAPAVALVAGTVDVVGMAAIRELVVEIDPGGMGGAGGAIRGGAGDPLAALEQLIELMKPPIVRLHARGKRTKRGDIVIPLEMIDYNRKRSPANRGRRPTVASNPTIPAVTTTHQGKTHRGAWLLDTGAVVSIISVGQARALGLLDADGRPTREPDFRLPLGGVAGGIEQDPGFVIERLEIAAQGRTRLVFRDAHVVVRDVSVTLDDERTVTLDGILGLNLLLPSATGLATGMPTAVSPPPFSRLWIDGPRRRLVLERR